jgi:Ca2+-binding EF-hand superfamily protein
VRSFADHLFLDKKRSRKNVFSLLHSILFERHPSEVMGNRQVRQLDDELSLKDYLYLIKQTRLTPYVIQGWYREFRTLCPNGQMNKAQFMKFYQSLTVSSSKSLAAITDNVFQAFDRDCTWRHIFLIDNEIGTPLFRLFLGNRHIDFKEFLIAYALTSIGEPDEKLQYTFSLFDGDRSESIEQKEMIELVHKLFILTGNPIDEKKAETLARSIFRKLDSDGNQSISRDEFIDGCLKNKDICQVLSPF